MIVIVNKSDGKPTTYNQVREFKTIENILILKTLKKQYFISMEFVNHIEIVK
jgi:hypothetical protein